MDVRQIWERPGWTSDWLGTGDGLRKSRDGGKRRGKKDKGCVGKKKSGIEKEN